jgi:hypothetical protein
MCGSLEATNAKCRPNRKSKPLSKTGLRSLAEAERKQEILAMKHSFERCSALPKGVKLGDYTIEDVQRLRRYLDALPLVDKRRFLYDRHLYTPSGETVMLGNRRCNTFMLENPETLRNGLDLWDATAVQLDSTNWIDEMDYVPARLWFHMLGVSRNLFYQPTMRGKGPSEPRYTSLPHKRIHPNGSDCPKTMMVIGQSFLKFLICFSFYSVYTF